jgi:hypothetical protein
VQKHEWRPINWSGRGVCNFKFRRAFQELSIVHARSPRDWPVASMYKCCHVFMSFAHGHMTRGGVFHPLRGFIKKATNDLPRYTSVNLAFAIARSKRLRNSSKPVPQRRGFQPPI